MKPKIKTKLPNKDLRKTVISDKNHEKLSEAVSAAPIMEEGAIIE